MLRTRKNVFVSPDSLINSNLEVTQNPRLSNKACGFACFAEISVLGVNKPGQLCHSPMPSPAPMPVPSLIPNPGYFPDMDIDDEEEDDMLWDNEDFDDSFPIAEC
ncbi:MAG: hypothetical protein P4L22_03865 [Candidatus Babeliales bacterium]|nr:hypothetical protein [Candidatus Babeliales bacterium]